MTIPLEYYSYAAIAGLVCFLLGAIAVEAWHWRKIGREEWIKKNMKCKHILWVALVITNQKSMVGEVVMSKGVIVKVVGRNNDGAL